MAVINSIVSVPELQVREEMREIPLAKKTLVIGLPKETDGDEKRVSLTPRAVRQLVGGGHRVLVEKSAGDGAYFSDNEYSEAGAEIMENAEEVLQADVVVKVLPPDDTELTKMRKGRVLVSSMRYQTLTKSYFTRLASKKTTALSYELIQMPNGHYPFLKAMSEIVGNSVVVIGASYLSDPYMGNGTMVGSFPGLPPTEIVCVGAGTVIQNACRVANGMGCAVKVFDDSIYKLRELQNAVGMPIYTSTIDMETLDIAIEKADILITAKHTFSAHSPLIVKESVVAKMKPGSVLIDVSIDQGGCCETSKPTTHRNPAYKLHDVTHYCVPNIASRVPRTASTAISNYLLPSLLQLGECGGIETLLQHDHSFSKGAYMFNGKLTNQRVAEKFSISYNPIELLLPLY